ncbi:hypothetical protein SprV_0401701900 [Sparganum proliferum]
MAAATTMNPPTPTTGKNPPGKQSATVPTTNNPDSFRICLHCDCTLTSRIDLADHPKTHRTETKESVRGTATYTRGIRLSCAHCQRTFSRRMGLLTQMCAHDSGIHRSADTPTISHTSDNSSISITAKVLLYQRRHYPDAIPAKLLKELAPEISKPVALIFQASFVTGCLPSYWKSATITPLFMGGSRASADNYRPVSFTSICCKIMEKIIKETLMQFLEQHHFLSDVQHGFPSGRSCLTNLLFTLERWTKARDEGNVVHAIYIDVKKAFDSVPHQRLLHKLRNAGSRGRLLVWIQRFLTARS